MPFGSVTDAHSQCCGVEYKDTIWKTICAKAHCKIEKKTQTRSLSLKCIDGKTELNIKENNSQNTTDECRIAVITEVYF